MHKRNLVTGFTLIELLMSMAIGLVVVNAAFICFFHARKAIVRTERQGAQNALYQNMMQWAATNGSIGAFPTGKQVKSIGRSNDSAYVADSHCEILRRNVAVLKLKDFDPNGVADIPPLYITCLESSPVSVP
jgi:prepilin-type N-terminal cleavage/methylation domain-containing protein